MADTPEDNEPFDVRAYIARKDREVPGFAAAVEAELAALRLDERLRELRKEQRITQAQLAKRLGMTQGAVAQMERSEPGRMEIRTAVKLAAALGYGLRITFEPIAVTHHAAAPRRARKTAKRPARKTPVRAARA
jgi:transcriptional regulator with XRE-family HTH domain